MKENYNQIIGNNLRQSRENLGLTQQELANKLDVTNRTIINWENWNRQRCNNSNRKRYSKYNC